jgi:hypothetical protein
MPTPANLVHETSTSTGTGNFTITALNGKQRFSTAFGTGATPNVFDYFISNRDAAEWERGTGHMSDASTLVRDTVMESTNSNSAVNFSAGTKDVANDVPAAKQLRVEAQTFLSVEKEAVRGNLNAAPFDALAYNGMQLNGDVCVSQEFGATGSTLTNNTSKYTADCWEAQYNHSAATAVVTSAQIVDASFPSALPGYSFAHQIRATTAIASPTNGDFARHRQKIEGCRVARLGWGASGAVSVSIAFRIYAMRSATLMLRLGNAAGNRFYHTNFPVGAGWNFITKTVPGDTSGTWDKTNSTGLTIDIFGLGKTSSPATADAWGASGAVSTSASDGQNQYSSNNDLTIVTGLIVLPGVELPSSDRAALLIRSADQELILCKRHYEKMFYPNSTLLAVGAAIDTSQIWAIYSFEFEKRASPTVVLPPTGTSTGQITFLTGSGGYPSNIGTIAALVLNNRQIRIAGSGYTGAWSAGQCALLYNTGDVSVVVNSRL